MSLYSPRLSREKRKERKKKKEKSKPCKARSMSHDGNSQVLLLRQDKTARETLTTCWFDMVDAVLRREEGSVGEIYQLWRIFLSC